MSKTLVSVIVPVYNAEEYINRCVDSLLSQTLRNIEIILIDDGSTDSSRYICEQYAMNDNRVKVISRPNRGVAMARQAGIEVASGIYSIHADPDDWVENSMLEELFLKAVEVNADMVISDFIIDFPDRSYCASQKIRRCESASCLNSMMYGQIHGSLCNKLIRTELYRRYDVRFFDGINYCEDYLACVQLFIHDIKIEYVNKAYYHYDQVVNVKSATRHYTKKTLQTQFLFWEKLCEILGGRQKKAVSHVIAVIAYDSYYYDILSNVEFVEFFGRYRKHFLKSKYKLKRKIALFLAASGLLQYARKIA